MKLQDTELLGKLSSGDLIAHGAMYHVQCLMSLYNKARNPRASEFDAEIFNHGIAFAALVSYIEDTRMDSGEALVFKLSDLINLYAARLGKVRDALDKTHALD